MAHVVCTAALNHFQSASRAQAFCWAAQGCSSPWNNTHTQQPHVELHTYSKEHAGSCTWHEAPMDPYQQRRPSTRSSRRCSLKTRLLRPLPPSAPVPAGPKCVATSLKPRPAPTTFQGCCSRFLQRQAAHTPTPKCTQETQNRETQTTLKAPGQQLLALLSCTASTATLSRKG
jgi:hypothetical protein